MGGGNWPRELKEELRQSKPVLVCWSRNSVDSTTVDSEARRALDAGKLIQVRIDDKVETRNFPLGFATIKYVDLSQWREPVEDGAKDNKWIKLEETIWKSTIPTNWSKVREEASKLKAQLAEVQERAQHAEVKNREFVIIQQQKGEAERVRDQAIEEMRRAKADYDASITTIAQKEDELTILTGRIARLDGTIRTLRQDKAAVDVQQNLLKNEAQKYEREAASLRQQHDKLNAEKLAVEDANARELQTLKDEIGALQKNNEYLRSENGQLKAIDAHAAELRPMLQKTWSL